MQFKAATLLLALSVTGLLAFFGWKAFSHSKSVLVEQIQYQPKGWYCPMRCLKKTYDHPGNCPVCHMKLLALGAPQARPQLSPWENLNGKTAVYFRPYTVQKIQVDKILRAAGRLSEGGSLLSVELSVSERQGLQHGATAMLAPSSGYFRPVLGFVETVGPGGKVSIRASHPLKGFDYALAEIRLAAAPSLAVPQQALLEQSSEVKVFLQTPQGYVPKAVSVVKRGERFVQVSGLNEGDVIAGSGVFWLDAQWRMDHP
jgi:hypothetical protein